MTCQRDVSLPWPRDLPRPRLHDTPAPGLAARGAGEDARAQGAQRGGVRPREVVFTGSGTEALNWVVYAAAGLLPRSQGPWGRRLVVSAVEHTAVLDAARDAAARAGLDLVEVPVDTTGRIAHFNVPPDTALVAVQHVNHETGVVQPVAEVSERAAAAGVRLLVDGCQGMWLDPPTADFLVVSSHKLGGPAGIAALALGRRVRIPPLFVGGEQELARRAGGENVAGAVGFGAACAAPAPHLGGLADDLVAGLTAITGVDVLGAGAERSPHIVAVAVPGLSGEAMLLGLDSAGIAANSGSSCSAERLEPSHVIRAMGAEADATLRFSLGWPSTSDDVHAVLDALPGIVGGLRRLVSPR